MILEILIDLNIVCGWHTLKSKTSQNKNAKRRNNKETKRRNNKELHPLAFPATRKAKSLYYVVLLFARGIVKMFKLFCHTFIYCSFLCLSRQVFAGHSVCGGPVRGLLRPHHREHLQEDGQREELWHIRPPFGGHCRPRRVLNFPLRSAHYLNFGLCWLSVKKSLICLRGKF